MCLVPATVYLVVVLSKPCQQVRPWRFAFFFLMVFVSLESCFSGNLLPSKSASQSQASSDMADLASGSLPSYFLFGCNLFWVAESADVSVGGCFLTRDNLYVLPVPSCICRCLVVSTTAQPLVNQSSYTWLTYGLATRFSFPNTSAFVHWTFAAG